MVSAPVVGRTDGFMNDRIATSSRIVLTRKVTWQPDHQLGRYVGMQVLLAVEVVCATIGDSSCNGIDSCRSVDIPFSSSADRCRRMHTYLLTYIHTYRRIGWSSLLEHSTTCTIGTAHIHKSQQPFSHTQFYIPAVSQLTSYPYIHSSRTVSEDSSISDPPQAIIDPSPIRLNPSDALLSLPLFLLHLIQLILYPPPIVIPPSTEALLFPRQLLQLQRHRLCNQQFPFQLRQAGRQTSV